MYRAQEVSEREAPELHATVRELAGAAGIPVPRVFLVPDRQPNAFATGRNPKHGVVAVTEGLLELLDHRELRGVLAHELSHIKNRDVLVSTVAAISPRRSRRSRTCWSSSRSRDHANFTPTRPARGSRAIRRRSPARC
jgi:Zn-dependent protease with chaperone function